MCFKSTHDVYCVLCSTYSIGLGGGGQDKEGERERRRLMDCYSTQEAVQASTSIIVICVGISARCVVLNINHRWQSKPFPFGRTRRNFASTHSPLRWVLSLSSALSLPLIRSYFLFSFSSQRFFLFTSSSCFLFLRPCFTVCFFLFSD